MITTYDFYTEKFHGDIISKENFFKYEIQAEMDLYVLTYGRLRGLDEFDENIQMAACALAELDYELFRAVVGDSGKGKNVKSKSSGNESISYETVETVITAALTDIKLQERLRYDTAARYLSGTGLLYAGV